ncbi:MAG: hypothetical protein JWQ34_346 [Mucilaginibacter sp.]|uniref:Panacea domain-containing protein n=1 Tax=Mucilaginibacter sp. TaxID=1882438 RepID=UPI00261B6A8D|nr:type II toxin-antitoxin system antitoxin SocA domain-containing protein [Mucilaginibacter sp.]MDB5002121.1 hypothetical protein [Mucilaginibacter sp.]
MNNNTENKIEQDVSYSKNISVYYDVEKTNTLNFDVDSFAPKVLWKEEVPFTPNLKVSVFDVAALIIKMKGAMTTMKLHKLLYYCQAWSLVWDERPLFTEKIEAWANGPVVKDLFSYHRGLYTISNISIGNPDLLDENQKETINSVLNYYGDKPSQWLIELTHLETPWRNARNGLSLTERGSNAISHESMAEYYSSL